MELGWAEEHGSLFLHYSKLECALCSWRQLSDICHGSAWQHEPASPLVFSYCVQKNKIVALFMLRHDFHVSAKKTFLPSRNEAKRSE